jgi:hypothetical protein
MSKPAKKVAPHGPQGEAYTVKITCAKRGCKETRWIKPQDAFQVRYCPEHQAEATKARRSAAAKAKRVEAAKAKAKTGTSTVRRIQADARKQQAAKKARKPRASAKVSTSQAGTAYDRAVVATGTAS